MFARAVSELLGHSFAQLCLSGSVARDASCFDLLMFIERYTYSLGYCKYVFQ